MSSTSAGLHQKPLLNLPLESVFFFCCFCCNFCCHFLHSLTLPYPLSLELLLLETALSWYTKYILFTEEMAFCWNFILEWKIWSKVVLFSTLNMVLLPVAMCICSTANTTEGEAGDWQCCNMDTSKLHIRLSALSSTDAFAFLLLWFSSPNSSHTLRISCMWEVSAIGETTASVCWKFHNYRGVSFVTESCYLLTGILCDKIFHVHVERERDLKNEWLLPEKSFGCEPEVLLHIVQDIFHCDV